MIPNAPNTEMILSDYFSTYEEGYFDSYYNLAKKYQPKCALEIGLEGGDSAVALLEACPKATLVSLDNDGMVPGPEIVAGRGLSDRFQFVHGDSAEMLEVIRAQGLTFDWIYIDGDHEYEGVKRDTELAWPLLNEGGVMVWDDYNPTDPEVRRWPGVRKAIDEFGFDLTPLEGHPHGAVYTIKLAKRKNGLDNRNTTKGKTNGRSNGNISKEKL